MENHDHCERPMTKGSWFSRHRFISYIGLGIIGYFLFVEHREHVLPWLPYLFLLACPLMHVFMHGGHHGQHQKHKNKGEEK